MMPRMSSARWATLLIIYRASKRRPNTVSLKCISDPRNSGTGDIRYLLTIGYLQCWRITHEYCNWQVGVSEKGERALSGLNVAELILDLWEDEDYKTTTTLISNMTKSELCELLAHSDRILRIWAQSRFESLSRGNS